MINLRSRLGGIATGDQAMFMPASVFNKVGGFPDIMLMEDIALSKSLLEYSRPACIHKPAITSSRRWEDNGILSTVLQMWILRAGYFIGIKPDRLARFYS